MIYPGAVWSPGVNAGYKAGHNRMQLAVCHYTVGRDSHNIGLDGYFHWLVRRNGEVVQYAEADAITWHAGTANQWGPGIEVEYLPGTDDDLWTPAAYQACARLVEWLIGLGIPDVFYDGPRVDPAGFSGFLTHRSVQQPDAHSDWWPDLPRLAPASPTPTPIQEATVPFKMHSPSKAAVVTDQEVYLCGFGGSMPYVEVDEAQFQYVIDDVRAKYEAGEKIRFS